MPNEIPQSTALAEARSDSLTELMSRDPESYQQRDLDTIIAHLREMRVRLAAAESEKPTRTRSARVPLSSSIAQSADDLGL